MTTTINVSDHILVPEHSVLADKEKAILFDEYNINFISLPKISKNDPALKHLSVKIGDVIKIKRNSPTSKISIYYRGVVNE